MCRGGNRLMAARVSLPRLAIFKPHGSDNQDLSMRPATRSADDQNQIQGRKRAFDSQQAGC